MAHLRFIRTHSVAGLSALACEPVGYWRKRFKSSSTPPPAPDPVAVANAQTGTNVGTAIAQGTLNNTNQVGPGGTTTFDKTGGYTDPTTGQFVPQFTKTTSLSPLGDQLLQGQQDLTNSIMPAIQAGGQNVGPLDITSGTNAATVRAGPQALNSDVSNAVYGQQAGFLNPQWNEQQRQLTDQLSRQGIPVGSDAYNNAMTNFNNSKTQAYQSAQDSATTQGANIAGQDFGLALQGQNQNVNQQQQQQLNPIALLAALTSGSGIGGSA